MRNPSLFVLLSSFLAVPSFGQTVTETPDDFAAELKQRQKALAVSCPGPAAKLECFKSADGLCGQSHAARAQRSPEWSDSYAQAFGLEACQHAALLGSEGFNFQNAKSARTYPDELLIKEESYVDMSGQAVKEKSVVSVKGGQPGATFLLSASESYNMLRTQLSGDTWEGDGADTFYSAYQGNAGYKKEFDAAFEKTFGRPFKSETIDAFLGRLRAAAPGARFVARDFADFIYDPAARNEPKATRFKSSVDEVLDSDQSISAMWKGSLGQGDQGGGFYGNNAAQLFVTASLMKLSERRLLKAIAKLKSELGAHPNAGKQLDALAKDIAEDAQARTFWTKVFYNGAQGRQAAGIILLMKFTTMGWLSERRYLSGALPGAAPVCEVYTNAMINVAGYRFCKGS